MPHLIIKNGPSLGQLVTFTDEIVIGRSYSKQHDSIAYMGLSDDLVSRDHCRIFLDENSYHIQDLGSTNGTSVGSRVLQGDEIYPVSDGVIILLGGTQLLFSNLEMRRHSTSNFNDMDITHSMHERFEYDDDVTIEVLPDDELHQDVSMIVDATQFLMEFDRKLPEDSREKDELLHQMQAMIQVSIAVGATSSMEELISKVTTLIFDLFKGAERTFVMLHDQVNDKFVPLSVQYRDKDIKPCQFVGISDTIIKAVVLEKQALLLKDAVSDKEYGNQDSIVDIGIHSVMCAPIIYEDKVLGLVQVDNRNFNEEFSAEELQILIAVCSQLAISIKNSQLYQDIEHLFEGFVRASVQAIESRDPSTAGHSFRVAEYTERLASAVDKSSIVELKDISFSLEQIQELRYAALLHDFGKVGVREHVLTKAKKLYGFELKYLKQRVKYAESCIERLAYKQLIDKHSAENLSHKQFLLEKKQLEKYILEQNKNLHNFKDAVLMLNEPGSNIDTLQRELEGYQDYKFENHNDRSQLILEPFEFSALCGCRGSLTQKERTEIESHVTHTHIFLSLIPWTDKLSSIPNIAHAHHERLDGSGYPLGLETESIPIQSKIMAIADVYDALTAGDRPYRQGINSERALGILDAEVKAGKLDQTLFNIFIESRSFQL